jgi:hypothetical protein
MVNGVVPPYGGKNPQGKPHTNAEHHTHDREFQCGGEKIFKIIKNRSLVSNGSPEVPLEKPRKVTDVLLGKGSVKSERSPNIFDRLSRSFLASHHPCRISWDGMGDDEDKKGHPDQDRDDVEEPL